MVQEIYRSNGLSICKNNHLFSSGTYGNKCPICGRILEMPGDTSYTHPSVLDKNFACGVMVGIDSPNVGKAYTIHAGLNPIGSDEAMKICIKGDDQIKPVNHTHILFDSQENKTYLTMNGSATGYAYLNDSTVVDIGVVSSGDLIKIGNSRFRYLELCTANFNWENDFGENNIEKLR